MFPLPEEFMILVNSLELLGEAYQVPVFVSFSPTRFSPRWVRYLDRVALVVRFPHLWFVGFCAKGSVCVVKVEANFGCKNWKEGKVVVMCTKHPLQGHVWNAVRRWAANEGVPAVGCYSYNNQTGQVLPEGFGD